jgi:hypothetical protein
MRSNLEPPFFAEEELLRLVGAYVRINLRDVNDVVEDLSTVCDEIANGHAYERQRQQYKKSIHERPQHRPNTNLSKLPNRENPQGGCVPRPHHRLETNLIMTNLIMSE